MSILKLRAKLKTGLKLIRGTTNENNRENKRKNLLNKKLLVLRRQNQ